MAKILEITYDVILVRFPVGTNPADFPQSYVCMDATEKQIRDFVGQFPCGSTFEFTPTCIVEE